MGVIKNRLPRYTGRKLAPDATRGPEKVCRENSAFVISLPLSSCPCYILSISFHAPKG